MKIREHSEQITMAMSNLSTHPIFLGYDWLKKHNPTIDWKVKTLQFMCENEHIPGLLVCEDDNEDWEPKHLFMIDHEYFRNLLTDIAIAIGEIKQTKALKKLYQRHIVNIKMSSPRKYSMNCPLVVHGTIPWASLWKSQG